MTQPSPADVVVMLVLPPVVWVLHLAAEAAMAVARRLDREKDS